MVILKTTSVYLQPSTEKMAQAYNEVREKEKMISFPPENLILLRRKNSLNIDAIFSLVSFCLFGPLIF
jgi:hypothetical protein